MLLYVSTYCYIRVLSKDSVRQPATYPNSRMPYALCLMPYALCLMPYALCLVYQVRQPVTMADFLEALSKISKSVGAEDILKHQKWMREFGAT